MEYDITYRVVYLYDNVFFTREELEILGFDCYDADKLKLKIKNLEKENNNLNFIFKNSNMDEKNYEDDLLEENKKYFIKLEDLEATILDLESFNVYGFGSNFYLSKESPNSIETGVKSAIKVALSCASINNPTLTKSYYDQIAIKGKKLVPNENKK